MFARIVTYTQADPSPGRIEQGIRRTREQLPGLRELDGNEGAYFFVDRHSGKAIFISLWESEQAMQRSDELMRPFRAEMSGTFAANRVDVEYYEVGENLVQEIRERELVEQELELARSIQQASLPKEVPTLEGWQIAPFYQPAREVGGDFYDFFKLDDDRVGVVVGDATGKGVPAALVVSATSSMLRAVARVLGSSSPGEVLSQVNETLSARIPQNMFVTCFYAILDPKSATLSYANAGHDLPYLRRSDGDVEELRARGMPLGLMPGMGYEEGEISLAEGHCVLFYSDGLVEAHNPRGEMFGFPRLRALVAEHDEVEHSLVDFLIEELYSFVAEGWEQEDDITLVTLGKIGGTLTAPSSGARRMISELSMPREPGNERQATEEVARAVSGLGLPERTLERLKTAVAEATMNAMEHGNRYDPDVPVKIQVWLLKERLLVRVIDRGSGSLSSLTAKGPDLEAKLEDAQTPRGWGVFLIERMVDEVRVSGNPDHHTVELVMRLESGKDTS